MKTVILAALAFACAFSLDAQITATLKPLPDGMNEVRIRNDGAVSLAAFGIKLKVANGASDASEVICADSATDAAARPLSPHEERVVQAGRIRVRAGVNVPDVYEQPTVTAGIFTDGATTGDAVLLSRLLLRRSNMLLAVETAMEMLSDAGSRNVPRDWLIRQFSKMADSVNHWYLPPEQQIGRDLYLSLGLKLMKVPEVPLDPPSRRRLL